MIIFSELGNISLLADKVFPLKIVCLIRFRLVYKHHCQIDNDLFKGYIAFESITFCISCSVKISSRRREGEGRHKSAPSLSRKRNEKQLSFFFEIKQGFLLAYNCY